MTGNLRRDIEVADGQVDHVGEALEATITGSSILDDFDNTVEALADGVGKVSVDEGEDVIEVIAQGCDELAQRRDTAAQCGGDPAPEELLRRAPVGIIPEVLKLVLEHPGAVDTAVGVAQAVEKAGMALGAISGVHAKQPAQPLDRLAAFGIEGAPLLLAHLVHGLVQGLDDVEAVDDQRGVGTVMLDRLGVGAAHIATGPQNARFLPLAQALIEEPVNALSALALSDPQDPGAVQIIDQGGELAALAEGDLVDAQGGYTADFMAVSYPVDDPVQQVRECRGRHTQDLGGGLLGHDLAQGTEAPLQAVADARIGIRPGDGLLHPCVGGAEDLLGGVPEQHLQAHEGEILPATRRGGLPHHPPPPPTVRAAAAVLVRLDRQVQLFVTVLEVKAGDLHAFQV